MIRPKKIAGATLVAVLVMSAVATGAASATKLTLSDGEANLAVGSTFEAFGEENLFIDTSIGSVECVGVSPGPTFGLHVEVMTNSRASDELKVLGAGGVAGEGQCRGGPLGHAAVHAVTLGPLKLNSKGKATEGPVAFHIEWERGRGPEGFAECYFKSRKLKGTNNATPGKEALEIEFSDQVLKLDKTFANSTECPREAQISFALTSTIDEDEEEERIEEHI